MTSVEAFREFINERLSAAAGEIFSVFEQTIVEYEGEICRQNKLLEILKPQIKLRRTELPQHHGCREDQRFEQETNYCLDHGGGEPSQNKEEQEGPGLLKVKEEQEEPEPPPIKVEEEEPGLLQCKEEQEEPEPPQIGEQEEFGSSQDGEQLIEKFESDSFREPSNEEDQRYLSESEELLDSEQLFSHDSEVHDVNEHVESESATNAELKTVGMFHCDHVENFTVSEKQSGQEEMLCGETCGITVRKKRKLSQNLGTVSGKKTSVCEVCDKTFTARSSLLRHMRTHTGEKPYSCETCGKRFSQQGHLFNHMRTHTGEKPHSCETCGKSFSRQDYLLAHMRSHSVVKPYSCETCGKRFSGHSSLLYHMRTHTGEKP
ncbi:zinc finger protein 615-like [Salarias fasciatus]|uniref:zinc finger protein 615-like n=1 Tax=Salarias fasciatus TaxID=181472 RepID=UPI0011768726|nr:zinc finger protein 615-like [Salarias fasciatus]